MASIIIGMIGKSGAGKDEVAKRLVAQHGFTRLAFADILKATALAADPAIRWPAPSFVCVPLSALVAAQGWDEAKKFPEVRAFLQRLGTAVRENLGQDAWVTPVLRQAADIEGPVVVTDVRYANEVAAIERHFGLDDLGRSFGAGHLVRVVRPGQHGLEGALAGHASETALDDFEAEFKIMNDRTIKQLQVEVDTLMEVLG